MCHSTKRNTLYQKISIGDKVISENARLVCTLENREKSKHNE